MAFKRDTLLSFEAVLLELERVDTMNTSYRNENEAIGVLLEEFDELKREMLVTHNFHAAKAEAIQVAAVAIRIAEFCEEMEAKR